MANSNMCPLSVGNTSNGGNDGDAGGVTALPRYPVTAVPFVTGVTGVTAVTRWHLVCLMLRRPERVSRALAARLEALPATRRVHRIKGG